MERGGARVAGQAVMEQQRGGARCAVPCLLLMLQQVSDAGRPRPTPHARRPPRPPHPPPQGGSHVGDSAMVAALGSNRLKQDFRNGLTRLAAPSSRHLGSEMAGRCG